jgi:hypothetical protein
MSMPRQLPSIETILSDPSISYWLKTALRTALLRDPVDAAYDALLLSELLGYRIDLPKQRSLKKLPNPLEIGVSTK